MEKINVYSDESRVTKEKFMLIGGIWVPANDEIIARKSIQQLRHNNKMTGEFKWTKVSNSKLPVYKEFVNIFFDLEILEFKCIVIDKSIIDYKTFHQGDKELGFYKFYFQLLSRKVSPKRIYSIYTDKRNNRKSGRLIELKDSVNYWCRERNNYSYDPIEKIEPRDSKKEDFIQLCDVLLGAVGYRWNKRSESKPKIELINHMGAHVFCQRRKAGMK